jgi:hypothetical protein
MSNALTWGDEPTSDDKLWGMLAHVSAFVVPWGLGALALYLVYKDKAPYVRYHAVQSLVVQVAIWVISGLTCGLGLILFLLPLLGAYKAYNGEWAGYPLIEGVGR